MPTSRGIALEIGIQQEGYSVVEPNGSLTHSSYDSIQAPLELISIPLSLQLVPIL